MTQKRLFLAAALTVATTFATWAQTVQGTILDAATGESIIGATVKYGDGKGVMTDIDGHFTIDVKSLPVKLNISFTGYKPQTVTVYDDEEEINVKLTEKRSYLNDVVVVGYGTQSRTQLTGSVATINTDLLEDFPSPTIDAALGGAVTGVDVTSNGQPGAGSNIRIRGGNSVNASNNPLYVIDGFIYYNDASAQSTGIGDIESSLDPLSFINPSDIERIEVLKDVSATAIYGSRGANGVIIVSTKKGQYNKTDIRYKATLSVNTPSKKLKLLNAHDWAQMEKDHFGNRGGYTDADIAALGKGTDWQDKVLRTPLSQIHELSLNGGTDKTRFLLSAGFTDQKGIVLNSDFERYNLRANIDHKVSEKVRVALTSTIGKTTQNALSTTQPVNYQSSPFAAGITNSLTYALFMPPVIPVYNADGSYNYNNPYENAYFKLNGITANPVSDLKNTSAQSINNYALMNASVKYSITEGLVAKAAVGANVNNITQNYFAPSYTALGLNEGGVGSIGHRQNQTVQTEWTLDYEKQLTDSHFINALVGYTTQSSRSNFNTTTTSHYTNEDLGYNNLSAGSQVYTPTSGQSKATLNSVIARVNYTLLDRYNATATFRADHSSRFSKNHRWGYFPSLGLSWNLDKETFTQRMGWLSHLKLRTSIGTVGNQEIGDYEYATSYTASNYGGATAYTLNNLGNSNLKWETTTSFDVGTDIGFWEGRLNFVIDYYYKKTSDLLLYQPVNSSTGVTQQLQNVGNVMNQGFEIGVDATLVNRRRLKLSVAANLTHNKNELTYMGNTTKKLTSRQLQENVLQEGKEVGSLYGLIFDGVDERTGKAILRDISGPNGVPDGTISTYDLTILGSQQPDFFYGISANLKWKNFDASISFKGAHGAEAANLLRRYLENPSGSYNALATVKDSWTPTNTHTDVPALTGHMATSYLDSRYVEDASYLKLQNLMIGYTFKPRHIVQNLRLFASAQNLFTITHYKGYDPELTTGIDQGAYPKSRTFSFGVEVNF
jgi:TonB-linked SusC/RagA family outer membrane protein